MAFSQHFIFQRFYHLNHQQWGKGPTSTFTFSLSKHISESPLLRHFPLALHNHDIRAGGV